MQLPQRCLLTGRAEKLQKEREEGKTTERKRKRAVRKKAASGPASSASEAIEKILQEKKISTKINYEVLKTLNAISTSTNIGGGVNAGETADNSLQEEDSPTTSESIKRYVLLSFIGAYLEISLYGDGFVFILRRRAIVTHLYRVSMQNLLLFKT